MNFGINAANGLSLVRILGSLSRTVGIIRQLTPIYKEIKPVLQKAPILFEKINSLRNISLNNQPIINKNDNQYEKKLIKDGPVFFQ